MQPETKEPQAAQWNQYRRPTGLQGREIAKKMNRAHWDLTTWGLKQVKIKPDATVLDVGCGGGKTISRLARRSPRGKVYGIDYSADMVDYSKQINHKLISQNRVEITEATVEKTGFKDEFFDLVTAIETYYFWPNLPAAFREIHRILKTDGFLLILSEMVKDGVFEVENAETIAKTHVKLLPLENIEGILRSEGFANVQIVRKRKSIWNVILACKIN